MLKNQRITKDDTVPLTLEFIFRAIMERGKLWWHMSEESRKIRVQDIPHSELRGQQRNGANEQRRTWWMMNKNGGKTIFCGPILEGSAKAGG